MTLAIVCEFILDPYNSDEKWNIVELWVKNVNLV